MPYKLTEVGGQYNQLRKGFERLKSDTQVYLLPPCLGLLEFSSIIESENILIPIAPKMEFQPINYMKIDALPAGASLERVQVRVSLWLRWESTFTVHFRYIH